MDYEKLKALREFMQSNKLNARDLAKMSDYVSFYEGVPLVKDGAVLPLSLRYDDNTVSNVFRLFKKFQSIHVSGLDVGIYEPTIPMPWQAAKEFCEEQGMRLPRVAECIILYSHKKEINAVLELLGQPPLVEYIYWLEDTGSKPYMRKAFNMANGKILEYHKCNSYRVHAASSKF